MCIPLSQVVEHTWLVSTYCLLSACSLDRHTCHLRSEAESYSMVLENGRKQNKERYQ